MSRPSWTLRTISRHEAQFIRQLAEPGWIEVKGYPGPLQEIEPNLNFVVRYMITAKEAAQRLRCAEQALHSLVDNHELTGLEIGNACFFSRCGVERPERHPVFKRRLRLK